MKRSTIWSATSLLLTFAVYLARPGILGEYFGSVYLAVALFLICIGLSIGRGEEFSSRDALMVFCAYGIYWGFRVLQAFLQGHPEGLPDLGKSIAFEFITITLMLTYLSGQQRRHQFYLYFCGAIAILGFSSMVSEVITLLGHADAISLYTFKRLASKKQSMDFVFQLPFSFFYDVYGSGSHTLYRYTGGFIEAGVYPAFGCWAIAYSILTSGKSRWIVLGCLLGIIATFATAAVLCLAVMVPLLCLTLLVRSPRFSLALKVPAICLVILAAPAGVAAMYFTPDIGLADKSETNGISLNDRSDNIRRAMKSMPSNPFGLYNIYNTEGQGSICLLAAGYSLGVVGLLLWFAKFGCTVWSHNNDLLKVMACISPLLLTLAVSQPLFDAMPAVIMLFFTRFSRVDPIPTDPVYVEDVASKAMG